MALTDTERVLAAEPQAQVARIRHRPVRFVSEFETEIGRLYLRMMDEPVPPRLLGILRTGLTAGKS